MIEFDVEGKYPEKILNINEVADVEYLTLRTDNDYLFDYIKSVGDKFVVCVNSVESNVLFFSRETGEPVSKVSRYGNGPGEYNLIALVTYSEEKDELFIFGYNTMKVYGRDGTFKRELTSFREKSYPSDMEALYDFDAENLLFSDAFHGSINDYPTQLILISKEDGHTTEDIMIPRKEKVNLWLSPDNGAPMGVPPGQYFAVRNGEEFLLTDYSADTVYRYTPEHKLIPVLVRKPSIYDKDQKTVLHSWLETGKYLFFSTEKVEFDWNTMTGFPKTGYMMERNSGKFYQTNIRMDDYEGKEIILDPSVLSKTSDSHTGAIILPASELFEADDNKKLSGKLKQAVGKVYEEDEFVIMLLKFR
ncbi:MAG: 6-bladed beta-propeller [Tannerellaceae bacterium]|nr:6-bladed beta-propeller [Tannerellaceae bacterium]